MMDKRGKVSPLAREAESDCDQPRTCSFFFFFLGCFWNDLQSWILSSLRSVGDKLDDRQDVYVEGRDSGRGN
jgi:hypothetical protein